MQEHLLLDTAGHLQTIIVTAYAKPVKAQAREIPAKESSWAH